MGETLTEVLTKESGCSQWRHGISNTKKWLQHIVMILNCIVWQCSPSVYYLFPISYRRPNTERSVVLPICTVSIGVRAMCKCCGTYLNVILIPPPMSFLDSLWSFRKATVSFVISVCLSVRLHGKIFIRWRLIFVHLQCGLLIHVVLRAFRIWRWLLDFWKICIPLC